MLSKSWAPYIARAGCAFCLSLFTTALFAEHPPAPELLPERTVALARIRDVPTSFEKAKKSAFGRMLQDEQVGPLVSKLYSTAQEAYQQVEAQVGVPLERLLAIPQGEAWIAVVPSRTGGTPALAILVDVKDQLPTVLNLLEKGQTLHEENGGKKIVEPQGDVRINIFLPPGTDELITETRKTDDGSSVEVKVTPEGATIQFEKDGTIVFCSTLELAQEIITNWSDKSAKSLAGNERFAAVMSRCSTGNDPPEFEWYLDPLTLAKHVLRGNVGAQTALTLLPAIGLDGIQAVGGTVSMQSGEFDEIQHVHLLLESPREGVLDLLALAPGDTVPENWVPGDVVSYMTFHWDLQKTYLGGTKIYDSFFGEGKAKEELTRRVKEAIDLDFESEVLASLAGRVTLCAWMEPPARLNSQCNLVGIQLADAKAFTPLLDRVVAKGGERISKRELGRTTLFTFSPPEPRRERPMPPEIVGPLREPTPCFAIVGDYLLLSDSEKCMEHALATISSGKNLAGELDFKVIHAKLNRIAGQNHAGSMIFARPAESLENLYTFATSKNSRDQLAKMGEDNEMLRKLHEALEEHPLPPFSALEKYFAPSGGVVTQDESGFHYQAIELHRK